MKRITLICGAPGSGKSTLARLLHRESGGWICEADFYMTDKYGNYAFDRKMLKWCHEQCQEDAEVVMEKSTVDVIVANTFTKRWERQPYLDMAEKYGYTVNLIHLVADYGNIHNVPEDVIQRMKANWENF